MMRDHGDEDDWTVLAERPSGEELDAPPHPAHRARAHPARGSGNMDDPVQDKLLATLLGALATRDLGTIEIMDAMLRSELKRASNQDTATIESAIEVIAAILR